MKSNKERTRWQVGLEYSAELEEKFEKIIRKYRQDSGLELTRTDIIRCSLNKYYDMLFPQQKVEKL